jgi:Animal haem peroxidase
MAAGERVAGHGAAAPRGEDVHADRDSVAGRFGRMFPGLLACDVSDGAIDELVAWMGDSSRSLAGNPLVPAGFTYLGQFIDHDITYDPTSKRDRDVDPEAVVNFRTPRLDLDSVYGSGPVVHPFMYDWKDPNAAGAKLLVGHNEVDDGGETIEDLPRNDQGRALIGDARNDENTIISQLHLLFIRFHNAVVDRLVAEGKLQKRDELLDRAQQIVRWHYQWIVVHEFLPLVVGRRMAEDVLPPPSKDARPTVRRKFFKWREEPFIPVEFSGAAYRFGHSMVRADYGLKRIPASFALTKVAEHTLPLSPDLGGFDRLRESLVIDWERFFALPGVQASPQVSLKIDTAIVKPLFELQDQDPGEQEVPRRNLERGRALGLPSGQDVACVMHQQLLTEDELELENMPGSRAELKRSAPLWHYILCETARATDAKDRPRPGRHLGPVGGRIVAEVLAGLLEADRSSYLHSKQPWQPELGTDGEFTMADLVKTAQG